ncbi:MAG: hypothetical protein ACFCU2_12580, partial [Acidimicrobiia bacterium]
RSGSQSANRVSISSRCVTDTQRRGSDRERLQFAPGYVQPPDEGAIDVADFPEFREIVARLALTHPIELC